MFSKKRALEDFPEQQTVVWTCTKEDCNCWMRDDYAFEAEPVCLICQSPMKKSTKLLPTLVNTKPDQGFPKKSNASSSATKSTLSQ